MLQDEYPPKSKTPLNPFQKVTLFIEVAWKKNQNQGYWFPWGPLETVTLWLVLVPLSSVPDKASLLWIIKVCRHSALIFLLEDYYNQLIFSLQLFQIGLAKIGDVEGNDRH